MKSRMLHVNWQAIQGARKKKKILKLRCNANGLYECPVESCLHADFKSQRGLRKHINNTHTWFYYFDSNPVIARRELSSSDLLEESAEKMIPPFSITCGIGLEFVNWLMNPGGGDKNEKEAKLIANRAMRFARSCLDDQCEELNNASHLDCCIGSPDTILSFFNILQDDWKCTATTSVCYVASIILLMDYRKTCPVSDATLRSFVATEVYLKRGRLNFSRRKRGEYRKNLGVENLIARNSWATLDEVESVIPFHSDRFTAICNACRDSEYFPKTGELVFATRFIIAFLFIRVKSTRPMSYRFLTLDMFESSKTNGGYVDQAKFKTERTYHFDTLVLTEPVRNIVQTYIDVIRPRFSPKCDYVLVNCRGNQFDHLHSAMNLLSYEAIGKFITPTIFRMVIETASMENLNPKEQAVVSRDQKHNSNMAKVVYQKKLAREVADEGRACVKKLVGDKAENHTVQLAGLLSQSEASSSSSTQIDDVIEIPMDEDTKEEEDTELESSSIRSINIDAVENTQADSGSRSVLRKESCKVSAKEIKEEEEEDVGRSKGKKYIAFSKKEDDNLKAGIAKYGKSNWARILKDSEFKFHSSRTRDALRSRASHLGKSKKKREK